MQRTGGWSLWRSKRRLVSGVVLLILACPPGVLAKEPAAEVVDLFKAQPESTSRREDCKADAPVDLMAESDPCAVVSLDEKIDCDRLPPKKQLAHPACLFPDFLPSDGKRRTLKSIDRQVRQYTRVLRNVEKTVLSHPKDQYPPLRPEPRQEPKPCPEPVTLPEDPIREILDPRMDTVALSAVALFAEAANRDFAYNSYPAWQALTVAYMDLVTEWGMRRHSQWLAVWTSRLSEEDVFLSRVRNLSMQYFELSQRAFSIKSLAYSLSSNDAEKRRQQIDSIMDRISGLYGLLVFLQSEAGALYDEYRERPLDVPVDPVQWMKWGREKERLCNVIQEAQDRFMDWLDADLPWQRRTAMGLVSGALLRQPLCGVLDTWIIIGDSLAKQRDRNDPETALRLYALGKQVQDALDKLRYSSLLFQLGGADLLGELIEMEKSRTWREQFVDYTDTELMKDFRRATAGKEIPDMVALIKRETRKVGKIYSQVVLWRKALDRADIAIKDVERMRKIREVKKRVEEFLSHIWHGLTKRHSKLFESLMMTMKYYRECNERLKCFRTHPMREWSKICGGKYFKCGMWNSVGKTLFLGRFQDFMHFASTLYGELEANVAAAQDALGLEEPPEINEYCFSSP